MTTTPPGWLPPRPPRTPRTRAQQRAATERDELHALRLLMALTHTTEAEVCAAHAPDVTSLAAMTHAQRRAAHLDLRGLSADITAAAQARFDTLSPEEQSQCIDDLLR